MDYRIEKKDAFKLVCRKIQVNKPQGDTATADISEFWNKCSADGTMEHICKYGKFDNFHGVLGVCFAEEMTDTTFPYGIGAEYNYTPLDDEGLDIVEIPAYTYAVFTSRGKLPDAFKETYKKIYTEFFPQSGYENIGGPELEIYPSADTSAPDYCCEIWVAVQGKK